MGRKNDLVTIIPSTYVSDNRVLLHIVDACPRTFHFVYLVRRDLPFMDAINRIITTFVETGIVNHWFTHGQLYRPISDHHHPKESHQVFTMKNVVIAFLFLMAGLTISGVVFVAELVYHHRITGPIAAPPSIRYPRGPLTVKWF
jgi:NADH:ubiquinone oxidoreductase subunit 5 (subunit L)/multisubunit Na+/H+ antiporter MnhA subunit